MLLYCLALFNVSSNFSLTLIFFPLHSLRLDQVLNISGDTLDGLFQVLSSILWIGNLEFEDTDSEACQLARRDRDTVRRIAVLLGLREAQVAKVCTTRQISVKGTTTDIALKYHEVRDLRRGERERERGKEGERERE